MSVINDMLKDLDARRGSESASVPVGGGGAPPGGGRRWFGIGLLLVAVAGLVVALGVRYRGWEPAAWAEATGIYGGGSEEGKPSERGDDVKPNREGAGDAGGESGEGPAGESTSADGVLEENAAPDAGGHQGAGAEDKASEGQRGAAPELAGLSLDTSEAATTLELQLTGGEVAVDHERDGAAGELRLSGATLADGLSMPATGDSALEGLAVVPAGDAVAVRYRAVPGARVTLDDGDKPESVALQIEPPVEADASATDEPSTAYAARAATAEPASAETASMPEVAEPDGAQPATGSAEDAADDGAGDSGEAVAAARESAQREPGGGTNTGATTASAGAAAAGQITRERRGPTPGEQAEARYRQALEALRTDDRATARAELREALDRDPGHTGARRALAMIHLRDGRPGQAGDLLRAGFDRGARTPALISLYARSWLDRGETQRAVTIMEEGRETVAVDADYMATLAALYQEQGRYGDAAAAYQAALERQRDVPEWWAGFGIALDNSGDEERAAQAYQRALRQGGLSDSLGSYVRQRLDALE